MKQSNYLNFPHFYDTLSKKKQLITHIKGGKVFPDELKVASAAESYQKWYTDVEHLLIEEYQSGWMPSVELFPRYYYSPEMQEMVKKQKEEGKITADTIERLKQQYPEWYAIVFGKEIVTEVVTDTKSMPTPKKSHKLLYILLLSVLLLIGSVIFGLFLLDRVNSLNSEISSLKGKNDDITRELGRITSERNRVTAERDSLSNILEDAYSSEFILARMLEVQKDSVRKLHSQISQLKTDKNNLTNMYNTIRARWNNITSRQSIIISNLNYNRDNKSITFSYIGLATQAPEIELSVLVHGAYGRPPIETYGRPSNTSKRIDWRRNYSTSYINNENSITVGIEELLANLPGSGFSIEIKEKKNGKWKCLWFGEDWRK